MLLRSMKVGLGATALIVAGALAGCAAQPQTGPMSSSGMTSQGGPQATALVNQGRFPAPMYSQEEQPSYALTGEDRGQWSPPDRYYQVGNDRIIFPATPGQ
jgi:hypothetical protein